MQVQSYIAGLLEVPTGVKTLADLIAFNTANAAEELIPPFYTSQSTYVFYIPEPKADKLMRGLPGSSRLKRAKSIRRTSMRLPSTRSWEVHEALTPRSSCTTSMLYSCLVVAHPPPRPSSDTLSSQVSYKLFLQPLCIVLTCL